jgi:hypothetical protein
MLHDHCCYGNCASNTLAACLANPAELGMQQTLHANTLQLPNSERCDVCYKHQSMQYLMGITITMLQSSRLSKPYAVSA